jgi:hypothetical protein
MPKGPKGQRPADVTGADEKVVRIAVGEEAKSFTGNDGKDQAAQSLGRRGGEARAKRLSSARRAEIAKKAAISRWSKR